jgi:protein TonB
MASNKNGEKGRKKSWLLVPVLTAALFHVPAGAQESQPKRMRVGGDVQQAKLVKDIRPIYPALARRARIEGTVKLQAVIGKDGSVDQVEVLSGHPVLAQAAQEAVKQWKYKPTLLNGEPMEVITTIEMVFKLTT